MVSHPTIAQLAERETVEAKQLSLGHWFESGWSEIFLFAPLNCVLCTVIVFNEVLVTFDLSGPDGRRSAGSRNLVIYRNLNIRVSILFWS